MKLEAAGAECQEEQKEPAGEEGAATEQKVSAPAPTPVATPAPVVPQRYIHNLGIPDQEHLLGEIKRENRMRMQELGQEEHPDFEIPEIEYTTVCNADFAPLICNEFVTSFLDKKGRQNLIERNEAIDLTHNFCYWLAKQDLTCAVVQLNQ